MLARRSSLCIVLLATLGAACGTDPEPNDTLAETGTTTSNDEVSGSDTTTDTTDTTTTDTDTTTTDTTDTDTETTGSGQCEGECGTPNCGVCPENLGVDIGGFSIGATEVRKADYALLLDIVFEPQFFAGWLPAECDWKADFTPTDWVPDTAPDSPVILVDWCDAWAYCSWSGQHLCGQIGGGPISEADINDPALAEWHKACTGNGVTDYPYGIDYDPNFCNGLDAGFEQRVNVGTLPSCEGGYPGVFDLSGNVWEWENSCIPDPLLDPEDQLCQYRGGSYLSEPQNMRCLTDTPRPRNHRHVSVGVRCCDVP